MGVRGLTRILLGARDGTIPVALTGGRREGRSAGIDGKRRGPWGLNGSRRPGRPCGWVATEDGDNRQHHAGTHEYLALHAISSLRFWIPSNVPLLSTPHLAQRIWSR